MSLNRRIIAGFHRNCIHFIHQIFALGIHAYRGWVRVALKQCNPNIGMENQKVDSYAAPVYKNAPFDEPSPPDAIVYRGHLPTVNKK